MAPQFGGVPLPVLIYWKKEITFDREVSIMPDEMKVLLRKNVDFRDDPGPPLDRRYETVTVHTSREPFVFVGEGDTARHVFDYIRRAHSKSGSSKKLRDCHAAVKADGGARSDVVFASG
ncbi:hypothetical protein EN904_05200 [Mesorhizobium sp. M7A.F.Ca.CA.001.07.2.1]|uniref:hypothetical protein n=1 Tax=Mesorhizobium TaxID=68287 RepID=UPI000FCA3BF0|nr:MULTISPECIES: hypothetical protein [Mesorhizobium]RUY50925.1 hypothetical protein EN973_28410 [Mesorhizobium sp. M7A.F.Ca.CA.001.12.1.1]RVA20001.1 hypothetical protein EN939_01390 [Mesorhizobium sp. M7A.F.Ca.CA.002.05.1.1]RVA32476.1 hypothetical protein EN930_00125 [Mesorhizobium sp. M7A.F.Ca.CA.004.11.2.1]RVB45125.1 hypothetical protein EN918_05080 [Mesorhizobium sp. M7A.F.Ca.CA.004.05.1.1]MCF6126250.1 hypothetical protein [Mesorhizobium ciceri]